MNEDQRIDRAINLKQQAFALLRQLQELRASMPTPDPGRRPASSPEDRLNAYSVAIHTLAANLRIDLHGIAMGLDIRGQQEIRREILPPSAKGLTDEQYLAWLDDEMGPEAPES